MNPACSTKGGNIVSGREHYYYSKGLYYKGLGRSDSAEYYFRKLQSYGYSLESSEGLLSLYEAEGNSDSIVKYARIHEQALMQWRGSRQSEAIIQSSAMYDYERNQSLAEQRAREVKVSLYLILFLFSALCLILLLVYLFYREAHQRQQKKQQEIQMLSERFRNIQQAYIRQSRQYELLQQGLDVREGISSDNVRKIQTEAQQHLEELERETLLLRNILSKHIPASEEDQDLTERDIVVLFKAMAHRELNGKKPTKREWRELTKTYKSHLPQLYSLMQMGQLSEQETYTCILLSIGFSNSDLVTLLSVTPQAVNNAKAHANKKLFNENSASTLADNLKKVRQILV